MVDWKRLFDDFHIPQRRVRGWSNVCCPFCRNPIDEHFNGGFSDDNPAYNCWRCGKHPWYEALSLVLKVSPYEARKASSSYGNFLSIEKRRSADNSKELILPGFEELTAGEENYLISRGFNIPFLQKKYGIRGGGIAGDWAYRIIVPVWFEGRLVSWTGRSILPRAMIDELKIPRYKNLSIEQSAVNPKDILFNSDNCRNDSVIFVEGPFDVLRMGDDTVCSLGTSVTAAQKLFLIKRYKHVFVSFDNEPAAQAKARKLAEDLDSLGMDVEVVNICDDYGKNDPGELTLREVKEIKKELFY